MPDSALTPEEALAMNFKAILEEDTSDLVSVMRAMELRIIEKYATMVDAEGGATSAASAQLKKFLSTTRALAKDAVGAAKTIVQENMLNAATTRLGVYEAASIVVPSAVNIAKVVVGNSTLPILMSAYRSKILYNANAAAISALAKSGRTSEFGTEFRRLNSIQISDMQATHVTAGRASAAYTEGEVAKLKSNKKIMAWKRWNATLERTCARCYSYHGNPYPATGGPFLPVHPWCACFYTFMSAPPVAPDPDRKFTNLSQGELASMIGVKLAKAVTSGVIKISEVVKPIYDSNGYITDTQVKRLSDFPQLKK